MDRYVGLDVHSASCTVGVLSAKGKRLSSTVLETNGKVLVEFLRLIPGRVHLVVEEGTQAAWLYEILSPHVYEMVVMSVPKSKGQKSDKLDAFGLAEKLRTGSIERRVYKGSGSSPPWPR
jgi:transposase